MSQSFRTYLGLLLLSTSTLTFEINLTRLFSVAQFYHFAFMIVSLALLGFGASGSFLAIFPAIARKDPQKNLASFALGTSLSILGAYLLVNRLPFDSFSIAWDQKQVAILILHYLALSAPFFFTGLAVSTLLTANPKKAGNTYAVNLLGSSLGCGIALLAPAFLGGEGTVILSSGLAALGALVSLHPPTKSAPWALAIPSALLVFSAILLGTLAAGESLPAWLDLQLSPYKSLSYALQYPKSEIISQRWNAFSRVDHIRSAGVRSLPGLSYRYLAPPPPEDGLLVDGDELSAVILPGAEMDFAAFLPAAIAFQLRPLADTLILEPRGGLDILTALELGARHITAVEVNPLIVQSAKRVYSDPSVHTVTDSDRSYIRRSNERFDLIIISLSSSYHPVRSGAYSLAEDYRYTVESFQDALTLLEPDGLLVVTRWLQTPPSESLRAFALAVTALENSGNQKREFEASSQIIAIRGYNTCTLLIKNGPFTPHEIQLARQFASQRAFDLAYAPGMQIDDANQYNILLEPVYYQAFHAILNSPDRKSYYAVYPFDISPPTDDRPFFGHYFKWSQAGQALAEWGKTWQPFGGAGYFVILALLTLSTSLAISLIVLPVVVSRLTRRKTPQSPPHQSIAQPFSSARGWAYLAYFAMIGFGFLLVEIPLIQRFILYLGHPAYSLTAILFTLLLFSGIGSQFSARIPVKLALGVLPPLLALTLFILPALFHATLGLPLAIRIGITVMLLAPLGFLMGIPFPGGIRWMGTQSANLIPWIWAVNGSASVIASVLAALLALSWGFTRVLALGALCYAGAWLTAALCPTQSPHQ